MEGLLKNRLLQVSDRIEFTFKKYRIYGSVAHGGHIGNTLIISPDGNENTTLQNWTYPSLTAWSEACFREGLSEENMRYASWKRVIHTPSQRTLQSLRSEYNVSFKTVHASRQDLFSEINRLHRQVNTLKRVKPVYVPNPVTDQTDNLLMESGAIEFFKKWNGTYLQST